MSNVYESMHEEALSRLCCVCGTIMKETFHYDVEKNLDLIRCGLNKPEFYPVSGATPWHFCKNCHLILRKLAEGKMIQTSLAMLNWQPCGIDCATCLYLTKRKSSRGRPKKVKRGGRPKDSEWSMSLIPSVKEMRYSINESVYSCNPGALLENFMCVYCNNIVVGPIFLKCEHSSCRSCFISENFKNPIKETRCTKCDTCLESPADISTSSLLQSCIDNLKVQCDNGSCNELVSLSSIQRHKESCNGLLSDLPKPMIGSQIRAMLAESKNGVIKIPTGGQNTNRRRNDVNGTRNQKQSTSIHWKTSNDGQIENSQPIYFADKQEQNKSKQCASYIDTHTRSKTKVDSSVGLHEERPCYRSQECSNQLYNKLCERNTTHDDESCQGLDTTRNEDSGQKKTCKERTTEYFLCRNRTWELEAEIFEKCFGVKFLVPGCGLKRKRASK